MKIAFEITHDPKELQQLLEITSLSITAYADGCLALALDELKKDNDPTEGRMEEKRELVTRLIDGEKTDLLSAARTLDYPLNQPHYSAVIWSEEIDTGISALEQVATAFSKACQQTTSLKIIVSPSVIWVWCPATHPVNTRVLSLHSAKPITCA